MSTDIDNFKLIALPAKPAAEDDSDILWIILVGSAYREESRSIELSADKQPTFWVVNIKARTFETAEALREQARRRLGLQALAGFCNAQRLRKEAQA